MLYLRTQYIYSLFILAFKLLLHFSDATWYFLSEIFLSLTHLKLVPTEYLLFSYSNTKVGFQQSRHTFSFSVKSRMSTTDEGPLHLDGQLSLTMVSIKLPTFQAETSMTKFHHCVAALPQDVATRLIDLIRDPTADPYTTRGRKRHVCVSVAKECV